MKTQSKILFLSMLVGVMTWVIDAVLDTLISTRVTFLEMLITKVPILGIFSRSIILAICILAGFIVTGILRKHHRFEEEIKGVNRALKVISESDKALVHAQEEPALLREICRIIVETGGYGLAWVGFAEQDEQRSVTPTAQWGEPRDYIETISASWAGATSYQCPTGTAIRSGKPVVVRDILQESVGEPWREKSLKSGHRSAIALPLTHDEQTIGALTIYTEKPEAFSQEEIKLLSGLADDLAYGIDVLRTRSYHKLAEQLIQEYYTSLAFLSQTVIDLIELSPTDNIYRYIGHQLHRLIKPVAILIDRYDKSSNTFEICESTSDDLSDHDGDDNPNHRDIPGDGDAPGTCDHDACNHGEQRQSPKKNLWSGRNLVGERFFLAPFLEKILCPSKLQRIQPLEIFPDTDSNPNPSPMSELLIEFLKTTEVFSIGLQKERILFGHVLLLVKKGKELKNIEVIETFVHQASIILHRRYIEMELKESENKFRLLAEMSPGAIFIHRGQKIIYANPATKIITGYSQEELEEMNFWEILAPPYRGRQKHEAFRLLKGKNLQNPSELLLEKKTGENCWVQMISKAFEFEGAPAVMVTAVDITQVKKAREMEKHHQQQLMQADKMISLGNLVAGVAHEINNPTNAIMVNTPVLKDIWNKIKPIADRYYKRNRDFNVGGIPYSEIPESMSDLLSGITESAQRIKTIVEDLKNFANPNPAAPGEMSRDTDVNEVVKQSVTLLHSMIAKATGKFSVDYGREIPLIKGNPRQLEQVFINLIRNACQALETHRQAIHVYTAYDPSVNRVIIGVKDEGPGIPPENLKFIMDPFFTTKRNNGGTGLGLSVSSRIVQDHHGEIEVESTLGKGSLFTVLLPVEAEGHREPIALNRPGPGTRTEGKK